VQYQARRSTPAFVYTARLRFNHPLNTSLARVIAV
jgi:hypothetical protein